MAGGPRRPSVLDGRQPVAGEGGPGARPPAGMIMAGGRGAPSGARWAAAGGG
jgi:hypothetical protein